MDSQREEHPINAFDTVLGTAIGLVISIACIFVFGNEFDDDELNLRELLTQSTAVVAVVTALLYVLGYLYEWHYLLTLGLPPELFAVRFEDYLVRGALTAVSCLTPSRLKYRFRYILPLCAYTLFLCMMLLAGRDAGSVTIPLIVLGFLAAVWVLLKGPPHFAKFDVERIDERTYDECFREYLLHTNGANDTSPDTGRPHMPIRCFLLKCTPKAVALIQLFDDRAIRQIVKREDVVRIDVNGIIRSPKHRADYFSLIRRN